MTRASWTVYAVSGVLLALSGCSKTQGDLGGACFANSTCNKHEGKWLRCDNGSCIVDPCPQGDLTCGCFANGTCGAGLFCRGDAALGTAPTCVFSDCNAGDLNCGCLSDRTCNHDSDGHQLVCNGRSCIRPDTSCDVGGERCPCHPNYACDNGLFCRVEPSGSICTAPTCTRGSLDCGCLETGACNSPQLWCGANGLCQENTTCRAGQGSEGCGGSSKGGGPAGAPGANNRLGLRSDPGAGAPQKLTRKNSSGPAASIASLPGRSASETSASRLIAE